VPGRGPILQWKECPHSGADHKAVLLEKGGLVLVEGEVIDPPFQVIGLKVRVVLLGGGVELLKIAGGCRIP